MVGVFPSLTVSSPLTSADLAKTFTTKARELFLNFQMPSTSYNAWSKVGGSGRPITTWTDPEDIVILIRNDVRAFMDVEVLANAFQIDKAVLLGNIYPVDNFDVYDDEGVKIYDGSKIVGMIADKSWFRIRRQDMFMDSFYNPNNRSIQYYLNNIKMYEYSLFANGVIFASGEATVNPTGFKFLVGGVEKTSLTVTEATDVIVETVPYAANATITYASSAVGKATVAKKDGANKVITITPVADGSSNITATVGDVTATLAVTVDV